jgi:hypothetical protein
MEDLKQKNMKLLCSRAAPVVFSAILYISSLDFIPHKKGKETIISIW